MFCGGGGGPNPLADMDRGSPNPRGVQIRCDTGQRTMSGLIVDLTGQTFLLPVMLTGQNSIVLKIK